MGVEHRNVGRPTAAKLSGSDLGSLSNSGPAATPLAFLRELDGSSAVARCRGSLAEPDGTPRRLLSA
jgi:hypothetical protein